LQPVCWQAHRCAAELERANPADKPDRQGVAMSRAILLDALFAIGFSVVAVMCARLLLALM
jgi:hypothetical protein